VLEFLTHRSVADFKQFINLLFKEQAYVNKAFIPNIYLKVKESVKRSLSAANKLSFTTDE